EQCRKFLDKIEESFDKKGFLNFVWYKLYAYLLTKKLNLADNGFSSEVVETLRTDLEEKELKENLKGIESLINKTGNLSQLLQNLNELRKKHKSLAVKILKNKRREALKSLI